MDSIVLYGVTTENVSVIATGSVVTKSITEHVLAEEYLPGRSDNCKKIQKTFSSKIYWANYNYEIIKSRNGQFLRGDINLISNLDSREIIE